MERSARRIEIAVFALVLGALLWFPDRTINTNGLAHFAQTYRIVHAGTLTIDPFAERLFQKDGRVVIRASSPRRTIDWSFRDGRYYPGKAPGVSLLSVPVYASVVALERAFGCAPEDLFETNAFLTNLVLTTLLAACAAVATLRLNRALGASLAASVAGALAIWLGTHCFSFGTGVLFSHVPSAAFVALAGACAFAPRAEQDLARPAALSGFFAGLATLTEYACSLLVLVLACYWLTRPGRLRLVLAYAAGGLGPLVVFAWYHHVCFGSSFSLAYDYLNPMFPDAGGHRLAQAPSLPVLVELTVLPFRGVFFYSPVLALAVGGVPGALRSPRRAAHLVGLAFFAVFLLSNATFRDWWGGTSTGPRYVVPALPLLGPAVAFGFARGAAPGAILLAASVANQLAIAAVDLSSPDVPCPVALSYARLFEGDLARPNLGTLVGLPGPVSVLPLALVIGGVTVALVRASARLEEAARQAPTVPAPAPTRSAS